MERRPENNRFDRLKHDFISLKACFTSFEQSLDEVFCEINNVCEQNDILIAERDSIVTEIKSLDFENQSLNAEKEILRTERDELRNENDLLIAKLTERDVINQKAYEFAKNVLMNNNVNGLQPVVNSLPSFSHQMVFKERSNSTTVFDSFSQIKDMRLTQSKEDKIINRSDQLNENSGESDGTFFDANSHRSSVTNPCAGVGPKIQQNLVSSTINSCPNVTQSENTNESQVTGSVSTQSYTIDFNNNLKLKLVKVPTGKVIDVSIAYIETPSSFWLHTNEQEVNNFIHVIQVKQEEMAKLSNSKLTSADITLGMYCAAIYSADGYWYRSQVIRINYENSIEKDSIKTIEVLFIDWGNSEELPLSKVMKLSHELTKRKQAIHCYCQGIGLESYKWPQKTIEEFKVAVEKQKLSAIFQKAHKLNEVLDSIIYPVDLMITFENGEKENIANYLPIPEVLESEDEEELNLIELIDETIAVTETLVCKTNSLNKEVNGNRSLVYDKISNKENIGRNLSHSVNSFSKCNETVNMLQIKPQSVPQCLTPSFSQSSNNCDTNIHTIHPPIVPDSNEGLIVQLTYIKNPSEFFVHVKDVQTGSAQNDDLDERLFTYYSAYEQIHETQVSDVTNGSFWSCQYSQDQRWYRARVRRIIGDKALISYIDYGNEELVEIKELMPLTLQFSICPALAVKCSLSSVSPNGGNEWSKESIDYFIHLTGFNEETFLTAYIGQKPSNFDFDSKLELFLWTNESKEQTAKEILINSNLVIEKYATTDNIEWVEEAERADRERTPPEVSSRLIEIAYGKTRVNENQNKQKVKVLPELTKNGYSEDDDDWDPMADDAYCDTNNYNTIPDDPATVTLGFHPRDRQTCKYYGTKGGCRGNKYCNFLHVNPDQRFAVNDEEEEQIFANDLELEVGSSVILQVTGIQSPNSFFGVLPFGRSSLNESDIRKASNSTQIEFKDLANICSELKTFYSNIERKENVNVFHAIGSLVAFKDEKHNKYYRGRVVNYDHELNCCTVFNVDLGQTLVVKRRSVFKLEPIFTQFPTLAIQCSLNGVQPFNTSIWTEQAIEAFSDWTLNKIFCAHILFGKFDNKVSVELIDYSNEKKEYISTKMIDFKFARMMTNQQSDDEIYSSDLD